MICLRLDFNTMTTTPTREELEKELREAKFTLAKCELRIAAMQFGTKHTADTEGRLYQAARRFAEAADNEFCHGPLGFGEEQP